MTREEILQKSRKENNNMDERELHTRLKAGNLSMSVGLLLCCLILILNLAYAGPKTVTFASWLIYWGSYSVFHWCQAIILRKKTAFMIAILFTVCAILYAYLFISATIGA